jgi:hypothetical protein
MNNFSPFHPLIIIIITTATIIRGAVRFLPLRAPVVMNNLQHTSSNLLIVTRPCLCCTLLPGCLLGCYYHDITMGVGFLTAHDEQCLNHPIQCSAIITFGRGEYGNAPSLIQLRGGRCRPSGILLTLL